jgi:hypothetical protein
MQPVFIVLAVAVGIVIAVIAAINASKRRDAMAQLAAKLGLRFDWKRNRSLAKQYRFLDKLRQGSHRYAFNILSGRYKGHEIKAFDYHYQTGSGDSEQDHYISFFMLQLPRVFSELKIGPEKFFSKVAQAFGYDDIDFESHEFSRKFCVRSADKKFAYDVCNSRMIEYLLVNSDLTIEIESNILAMSFDKRLSPELIEPNLNRLIKVRSLLPSYLFSGR